MLKHTPKSKAPYSVLMLHGFGADAEDVTSLAPSIAPAAQWYFPQAPIKLKDPHSGRAWFRIENQELHRIRSHQPVDTEHIHRPPGLKKNRLWLLSEMKKCGVQWNDTVIAGFSQGAMMAIELGLQLSGESPKALLLFSLGTLTGTQWDALLKSHKDLPIFISHGTKDSVIHIEEAREMHRALAEVGSRVEYHDFNGDHEIPIEIQSKAKSFLAKL